MLERYLFLIVVLYTMCHGLHGFLAHTKHGKSTSLMTRQTPKTLRSSYLDELNVFKAEKKVLVGLTTVSNIPFLSPLTRCFFNYY